MEEKAEREKKVKETRKTALERKEKERRALREKERMGKTTERKIERKGEGRRVKIGRDPRVLGKEGNERMRFYIFYNTIHKFKFAGCERNRCM